MIITCRRKSIKNSLSHCINLSISYNDFTDDVVVKIPTYRASVVGSNFTQDNFLWSTNCWSESECNLCPLLMFVKSTAIQLLFPSVGCCLLFKKVRIWME